ncbi:MAG: zinc-dependent peptidase [Cytophagales bacterium]|nr:zinc-dependent peptidase [Cytophagales bacterium]
MKVFIGIGLLLFLVMFILYNIIAGVRVMIKWYFGDYINKYLLVAKIDPLYKVPLKKYSKYYQKLNHSDKTIFEKRVQKFINQKQFIARGMDGITDEMKSLIAGSAIQLTFGHPSIYFAHFRRILVYPDDYYSQISRRYHKGEVNTGGLIVLSWKNFVEGYIDHRDGKNLGLHEMAHALRLENAIRNEEYGFLDDDVLKTWTDLSYREMQRMEDGESDFFRTYAATNSQEFFAVAVENFFERPKEFYDRHPKIYNTLAQMLNQNPLRIGKAS